MEKGHIVRRIDNEPAPQIIAFESYAVDLNQLEQRASTQAQVLRPRERYTTELLSARQNDPQVSRPSPGAFTSELHERFPARSIPSPSC